MAAKQSLFPLGLPFAWFIFLHTAQLGKEASQGESVGVQEGGWGD